MCVQPDRRGAYLQLEGDLNAGATVKIAGASGQVSREDWDGINQRLDQYKTDPWDCAVQVLKILAPLILKPPAPPAPTVVVNPPAPPPSLGEEYSYPVNLNPNGDNWLALRSEPGSGGYRIKKMGPETLFTVFGEQGDWAHVRLRTGETGWAAKAYVGCCRAPDTVASSQTRAGIE